MKKMVMALCTASLLLMMSACGRTSQGNGDMSVQEMQDQESEVKQEDRQRSEIQQDETGQPTVSGKQLAVQAGDESFTLTLENNAAAAAFREMLPLTLDMKELNGNEKYCYLDSGLPSSSESVGTIENGDFMLFGSDCLVLFYDSFSTGYTYTRLGRIDDPAGLARALGSGSAAVTFSMGE